jgi:hypothetical protein
MGWNIREKNIHRRKTCHQAGIVGIIRTLKFMQKDAEMRFGLNGQLNSIVNQQAAFIRRLGKYHHQITGIHLIEQILN